MQVFRKRFLYNSQKPLFSSSKVRSYNCMNTQTKDARYLLLHHLQQIPFVDPSPNILQPIEEPTDSEPYSVYPMVNCCSEIGKVNEADAMYVLKCILESKQKNPLYLLLAPQGICTSEIQGLLPEKSPPLFKILIELLDLPDSLAEVERSVVSKEGYQICRIVKGGDNPASLLAKYGWKQGKKGSIVQDDDFWIFKGRKKQDGPFNNEYGLAWHSQFGISRFKYIDLQKDGYQEQFYANFKNKIEAYKQAHDNKMDILKIYKFEKDSKGIKLFTQVANQGPLSEYITVKKNQGKTLTEENTISLLETFVLNMQKIQSKSEINAFGMLHLKNIFVHNNRLTIGQPLLVTDKIQKKIRELKNGVDYFAPELKQNILIPENLFKLDFDKMDVWFFGFMLHKIIVREIPVFDPTRKPILSKDIFSPGMFDLITRCLSLTPANRPQWTDINLRQLNNQPFIQDVQDFQQNQRDQIKLGTRKQRITSSREPNLKHSQIQNQFLQRKKSQLVADEMSKLKSEQMLQEIEPPVQTRFVSSSRFRKFKTILRIVFVMVLYIFVFFRPFLGNSIDLLLVRGYYSTASLHLINRAGDRVSTATILTNNPNYFLLNDIDFEGVYSELNCIDNRFNPIHDPDYKLNDFVQSGSFLALLLTGWLVTILICATKAFSMWKGGIGNQSQKNVEKYWFVYSYFELSMACLLFAHFYFYQFFYFSVAEPCFGIQKFQGIEPFFDSSLYIFLGNQSNYMGQVFASLGIMSIILLISSFIYAWSPKADAKNFFSPWSIILRVTPYVLIILICRVGLFFVLTPTAINDQNQLLTLLMESSFIGVLGILPEIFILIVVIVDYLLQMLMIWLEKKIMSSSEWTKFFGLKRKKGTEGISKINKIHGSKLNDMSMLELSKIEQ